MFRNIMTMTNVNNYKFVIILIICGNDYLSSSEHLELCNNTTITQLSKEKFIHLII